MSYTTTSLKIVQIISSVLLTNITKLPFLCGQLCVLKIICQPQDSFKIIGIQILEIHYLILLENPHIKTKVSYDLILSNNLLPPQKIFGKFN